MSELRFDTQLSVTPVTLVIEGEDRKFELRELLGRERESFLNELQKQTNIVAGKPVGMKDYRGVHAMMLTKSLFDDAGKNVTKEFVQGLPARVATALFAEAQKMSGIEQSAKLDEEVKND